MARLLARVSEGVRYLAAMILGCMSSLGMARALLAAVEHKVPKQVSFLLCLCAKLAWSVGHPSELLTDAFRLRERRTVAGWTRKRAAAYLKLLARQASQWSPCSMAHMASCSPAVSFQCQHQ